MRLCRNEAITDEDSLELSKLGDRKQAIFCVIPDSNDVSLNFLVGMLYTQAFQELYYQADKVHMGGLPVPVRLISHNMPDMRLLKNDVVIVSMEEKFNSGDLVIAQGKDEPADCVRIYKQSDDSWIVLSDAKEPTCYSQEQQKEFKVIGKVVALNRTFI